MKPPPTGQDLQARVFAAMCDDLFDMGAGKARSFDRVNAILEITRATATTNAIRAVVSAEKESKHG